MAAELPELTRRQAEQVLGAYCEARIPASARDQVRLTVGVRGATVTLYEERVPWSGLHRTEWTRTGVAQFRYDEQQLLWTLYWPDRNERWHRFEEAPPSAVIDDLLRVVEDDPTAIFWG